jgi:hypothetical protein
MCPSFSYLFSSSFLSRYLPALLCLRLISLSKCYLLQLVVFVAFCLRLFLTYVLLLSLLYHSIKNGVLMHSTYFSLYAWIELSDP